MNPYLEPLENFLFDYTFQTNKLWSIMFAAAPDEMKYLTDMTNEIRWVIVGEFFAYCLGKLKSFETIEVYLDLNADIAPIHFGRMTIYPKSSKFMLEEIVWTMDLPIERVAFYRDGWVSDFSSLPLYNPRFYPRKHRFYMDLGFVDKYYRLKSMAVNKESFPDDVNGGQLIVLMRCYPPSFWRLDNPYQKLLGYKHFRLLCYRNFALPIYENIIQLNCNNTYRPKLGEMYDNPNDLYLLQVYD